MGLWTTHRAPVPEHLLNLDYAAKWLGELQNRARVDDIGCASSITAGPQLLDPELPRLMAGPVEDVVAGQRDALLPLWAVLGIVTGVVVLSLLVKLYTVLTIGKCSSNVDMTGKTVIITGANTGIGKETARELARRNARVILACRNLVKAREAAADICASTGRSVALMQLDLCSLLSVRQFAAQVVANEPRLDVLILNAGMMSPPSREETEDGFEATFQANHLGHFLLTHLLLDLLKKSRPSRIVVVGSCGQLVGRLNTDDLSFGPYWFPLLNYCTTKQCNMLFTVELSKKLEGTGVTVNCCHPGFVRSEIAVRSTDVQTWLFNQLLSFYGKTVKEGAETTVYLAVSEEVQNVSGKYFKDCASTYAVPWATNPAAARKLYDESIRLTQIEEVI
ncbi:retinol dehydrogenase 11 isoform X1 [Rhipicephalus microplus]|uniref:retinol dehydrogenase 11 isoform X1 n=2 Tax=Rhipicephalus microplus TaxID=6941 RepID=UPI003F6C5FCC